MAFPSLAFLGFAVAASITPGPNNVMVSASAAHHGVRRTVPHILGIAVGFGAMVLIAGLGLAAPLALYPRLQWAMRTAGIAWILVIAWKTATAPPPGAGQARRPMGFMAAAAFQWINPKAWMLVIGVAGAWISAGPPLLPQVAAMAAIFLLVCIPAGLAWALLGAGAASLLRRPARLRAFNVTMAVLLVASLLPVLGE